MTSNFAQAAFDRLIQDFDEYITLPTAATLAAELGVRFDPETYDF